MNFLRKARALRTLDLQLNDLTTGAVRLLLEAVAKVDIQVPPSCCSWGGVVAGYPSFVRPSRSCSKANFCNQCKRILTTYFA